MRPALAILFLMAAMYSAPTRAQVAGLPIPIGRLVRACVAIAPNACPTDRAGARDEACVAGVLQNEHDVRAAAREAVRMQSGQEKAAFSDLAAGRVPATVHVYANVLAAKPDGSRDASYEIKIAPGDHRAALAEWEKGGPGPRNFYAFPADFLGCRADVLIREEGQAEIRVINASFDAYPTPAGPEAFNEISYRPTASYLNRPENQFLVNGETYVASEGYDLDSSLRRTEGAAAAIAAPVLKIFGKGALEAFRASGVYYWPGRP